ncbi:TIM barrel protein [Rhodobacteraceae bacterium 2CG4]|uniref:TIM barrel protein n=1 Tax=Halovulum marinum TaxID=2662447 RepID=A0A6L5Z530_9RHOB|nr:sugar phosphate isomerase/epimerase family protein [Halovulum marinum]MSU91220.1 TIM barrel protein [Halovulum marinum]
MKFGIHAGLWMDNWSDDPAPLFDRAARIGFDGVELSLLGVGPDQTARLRAAANAAGVALTCSTGLGPDADPSSADPAARARAQETLARAIETVAALGASGLAGVVAAPWGVFDPAAKTDRARRSAETLGRMQDHLAQHGVTLGIEALNRFESDLTSTAAETCAIARASGAANVGVLLDSFHMNIEEKDPPAALRAAGDALVHYHVSDNDRGVPGSGRYDFAADAQALAGIGYRGWIVAEMFVRAGRPTSADLNIWRDIEPDADAAAAQALAHMKTVFADVG